MPILTAGYGNRGFEGFVALMKRHGVTHVVDVRSVPQSGYWEDFRRERLHRILPEAGLRYVYMGDTLGGVSDRSSSDPSADMDGASGEATNPIFCKVDPPSIDLYPLSHDPKFRLGLAKLVEAMQVPGRTICLMCGCMRPHKCHRSRLIGADLVAQGIDVFHIDDRGKVVTQEQVSALAIPRQAPLF